MTDTPPVASWLDELRQDCGLPSREHEWVRCRSCQIPEGACPCAGGPCCHRELEDLAAES